MPAFEALRASNQCREISNLRREVSSLRKEISDLKSTIRRSEQEADMRRFAWCVSLGVSGSIVALVKLLP